MDIILSLLRDRYRPSISLDIDNTLADIYPPMFAEYNRQNALRGKKKSDYKISDLTAWDWSTIGSSWSEMVHIYERVWIYRSHEIGFLGDVRLLNSLQMHYEVELVTAKDNHSTVQELARWLERHNIGHLPLRVIPINAHKSDLEHHIYIDDAPHLAESVRLKGGKVMFLVDSPTNQDVKDGPNVLRVRDVNGALQLLVRTASVHAKEGRRVKTR